MDVDWEDKSLASWMYIKKIYVVASWIWTGRKDCCAIDVDYCATYADVDDQKHTCVTDVDILPHLFTALLISSTLISATKPTVFLVSLRWGFCGSCVCGSTLLVKILLMTRTVINGPIFFGYIWRVNGQFFFCYIWTVNGPIFFGYIWTVNGPIFKKIIFQYCLDTYFSYIPPLNVLTIWTIDGTKWHTDR